MVTETAYEQRRAVCTKRDHIVHLAREGKESSVVLEVCLLSEVENEGKVRRRGAKWPSLRPGRWVRSEDSRFQRYESPLTSTFLESSVGLLISTRT